MPIIRLFLDIDAPLWYNVFCMIIFILYISEAYMHKIPEYRAFFYEVKYEKER